MHFRLSHLLYPRTDLRIDRPAPRHAFLTPSHYTREGDRLNAQKFRNVLGHQFIAGSDDKEQVDLVQVYLGANKSTVSYANARKAVEKAYWRFGEPSPFDGLNDQPMSPPPTEKKGSNGCVRAMVSGRSSQNQKRKARADKIERLKQYVIA